jgi:hypothetical protein
MRAMPITLHPGGETGRSEDVVEVLMEKLNRFRRDNATRRLA